jgi:acyl transferase domain-containing protein/acyl carrier protein
VAIIGMAGRFPGADDIDALWTNLVNGVESLTRLTDEQLREQGVPEALIADPRYVRLRPLLADMEGFDSRFFGYHAREAEIADPQHRVFLEVCSTALQHAGYDTTRYGGRVGVFGGSGPNRYNYENVYHNKRVRAAVGDLAIEINNNQDYLAARVAYAFALTGPAISVATACSTSLVAVHMAYRALTTGECTMAIAGGVNIALPYHRGQLATEDSIYSPDGHIRAFDESAAGTNFGHGAGAVVLKRYAEAVADGDYIHAVIVGSAVNNDGARRTGFSAPGAEGQTAVIAQALAAAGGIAPDSIGYVEAHGTGTAVGDPIEIAALTAAYRAAGGTGVQACPIGSVKTNVGHLGPAAGIAGLIKTVLALKHGQIPASLNFEKPKTQINFPETPFFVNQQLAPWPTRDTPRRAGVSSFGIGGTNAHVIVQEAPQPQRSAQAARPWHILPLSAKTDTALAVMRTVLETHLHTEPDQKIADVAYTLQVGRPALEQRAFAVCQGAGGASIDLIGTQATVVNPAAPARVAFMFPGQGAQYVGMAQEIYRTERVFREVVDEAAELVRPHLGCDLRDVVFGGPDEQRGPQEMTDRLRQTRLTQPAMFVIEYALARQWMSWGVEPSAMVGHSVGEYVAACLAGVFGLADALELVAARGRLTQSMPAGAMLAVPMAEADLDPILRDGISIAALNGPRASVLAGPVEAIRALRDLLASTGVQSQVLQTSHAFHSAMLDPIVGPIHEAVAAIGPNAPDRALVSTMTGDWMTSEQAVDPGYWAAQLRGTVRFGQACQTLAQADVVLLEVGPGQSLTAMAKQSVPRTTPMIASLARPGGNRSDARALAEAAGRLWAAGVLIDWSAMHDGVSRQRVPLPTYPYERRPAWVEPDRLPPRPVESGRPTVLPAQDATFLPVWRRQQRARPAASASAAGPWLIFSPGTGPAEAVADELAARGAEVVRVAAGSRFEDLGEGRHLINPSSRADYDQLLRKLENGVGRPTAVLHGWTATATAAPGAGFEPGAIDAAKDTGFYSLLFLSQAMMERWPQERADIRVVTSNCCNVSGMEQVEPGKALLLGPCRVVPTEAPLLDCQLIDVAPVAPVTADGDLEQLLDELSGPVTDPLVAYRSGRRWVADYQHIALPPRADLPKMLRRRGVYLITGGLGGIGLEVAKELARSAEAKLVLVNRSPLPDREHWPEFLATHGDDDPQSVRIIGVRQVESLGGEVMTAAADVTDELAMAATIDAARNRFGRIDGVFHAAGVAGAGLAVMRTREQSDPVLAAKVDGTLIIDRLLGDEIELLVLFSSIVSISGDYGMVDYCAANAFLDAFAHARAGSRRHTVAVNWCGWTGTGMIEQSRQLAPQGFRELEQEIRHRDVEHPLLGRRILNSDNVVFSTFIDPRSHWVLTDHTMAGRAVLPGTAYAEMIRAAYAAVSGPGTIELSDLIFLRPLGIEGRRELRVTGQPRGAGRFDFTVTSRLLGDPEAPWEQHAQASADHHGDSTELRRCDLASIIARCDGMTWRPDLGDPRSPVAFGPHWQVVRDVRLGDREELVRLEIPEGLDADLSDFVLHPSLLDGATSLGLFMPDVVRDGRSFLPMAYDRIIVRAALPARIYSHIRNRAGQGTASDIVTFDIAVLDESGVELVTIEGFRVRPVDTAALRASFEAGSAPPAAVPTRPAPSVVEQLISPGQGLDLMWRILDSRAESQYVISRERVADRIGRISRIAAAVEAAEGGQFAGDAVRQVPASRADATTVTSTEDSLLALWEDAFGATQIGLDEDFFDLGGNSLVAVQLAVRIRERFGINVPGVAVLEYPTVRTLAVRVEEALAEAAAS